MIDIKSLRQKIMIKKIFLLISFITFCYHGFSQKQANFWYFGDLGGLDFNSGSPVIIPNSPIYSAEGSATMSDSNGNLLFYTDGVTVWDNIDTIMKHGTGLHGDVSTTQSAIIIPNPGNANLYYIFTIDDEGGNLEYSVVDMTLHSGKGDVDTTKKNIFLRSTMTEKLSATYHCNGHDIWVMAHDLGNKTFTAYLVTNSGVTTTPVISNTGSIQMSPHGYMKFSTKGKKIVCTSDSVIDGASATYKGNAHIDLLDFDNSTGIVSNPTRLSLINHQISYGLEFSPDNSKLYVSYCDVTGFNGGNSYVGQFDLNATNIQSSFVQLGISTVDIMVLRAIQLGPDHKIYISKSNQSFLCVINNPNIAGTACNYVDNALNIDPGTGSMCSLGLPNFLQNYLDPAFPVISPCIVPVTANFVNSDTTLCKGDCISFTDQSTGTVTGWNWTFQGANPSSSSNQNPSTVCYSSAGTYTVRLIASNSSTSDTLIKTITVVAPTLNAGPDLVIAPGGSVQLNATGNVTSFSWSPVTGLSDPSIPNPVATPSVTTTYIVTGSNSNNCPVSSAVTVNIEVPEPPCGEVFVPTGFTPNNDGENDIECVLGSCIVDMTFSIYDRWGEKVFETSDKTQCWDGSYRGVPMNTGIFVYHLKATLKNGDEINKKGNINLIR